MRPVYMIGDKPLTEDAMARLMAADRLRGAPIVIVDGHYFEAPKAAPPRPRRPAPRLPAVTDPSYLDRAKVAAEAKRARKAARRTIQLPASVDTSRDLIRQALGLPNAQRQSYRNRFYVPLNSATFKAWLDLVEAGLATGPHSEPTAAGVLFRVTDEGAKLALEPGETLCPEDFPNATRQVSA